MTSTLPALRRSHATLSALGALVVPAGLAACGAPISNTVLEEDAIFVASLPSAEEHRVAPLGVDVPEDTSPLPSLWLLTMQAIDGTNALVDGLLPVVDAVRATPPSERTDNGRRWTALPGDDIGLVRLEIDRTGTGEFQWRFLREDNDVAFLYGTHLAGESVARGLGQFTFDLAAVADATGGPSTRYDVAYDHLDSREILATITDPAVLESNGTIWFREEPEGARDFEFRQEAQLVDGGATETWEVRTRWLPEQGGRGDAWLLDTKVGTARFTQCWDPAGGLLAAWDDQGWSEPTGSQTDCVFADAAEVQHLDL